MPTRPPGVKVGLKVTILAGPLSGETGEVIGFDRRGRARVRFPNLGHDFTPAYGRDEYLVPGLAPRCVQDESGTVRRHRWGRELRMPMDHPPAGIFAGDVHSACEVCGTARVVTDKGRVRRYMWGKGATAPAGGPEKK